MSESENMQSCIRSDAQTPTVKVLLRHSDIVHLSRNAFTQFVFQTLSHVMRHMINCGSMNLL